MNKERPMRILHIVESFSTGVYAVVRDLSCGLDPDSFTMHIIYSLRSDSPQNIEEDFPGAHITLEYIPMGSWQSYIPAMRKIRRSAAKFSPDVVHCHSSKAGFLGRLALKKILKKNSRGNMFYSPHGFSFLRTDVGRFKRGVFLFLEMAVYRYTGGTIISVSPGEQTAAQRITDRVVLIPNFIEFASLPFGQESDVPIVITSGRISPQKNPVLFQAVAERLPDLQFRWVGDGPLRNTLTAENIEVTGFVERQEVLEDLGKAWVYLQTSLWEGMPISLLEAMGMAKPVVVTDCIGNRDLVQNGKTGFLHSPEDVEGITTSIQSLIDKNELRKYVGTNARAYVREHNDIESAVKQYARLYREKI